MLIKRFFYFLSGAKEEYTAESVDDVEHLGRIVCYRDRPFQYVTYDKTGLIHEATYGEISQFKFTKFFNGVYDEVLNVDALEDVPCTCGAKAVGSMNHTAYCDISDSSFDFPDEDGDTLW